MVDHIVPLQQNQDQDQQDAEPRPERSVTSDQVLQPKLENSDYDESEKEENFSEPKSSEFYEELEQEMNEKLSKVKDTVLQRAFLAE